VQRFFSLGFFGEFLRLLEILMGFFFWRWREGARNEGGVQV
jgi:hypothetical protein